MREADDKILRSGIAASLRTSKARIDAVIKKETEDLEGKLEHIRSKRERIRQLKKQSSILDEAIQIYDAEGLDA